MLIGILSDTHNQRRRTESAVRLLQAEGAEALFHCGDLTDPDIVAICSALQCYFVLGNNDLRSAELIQAAIEKAQGSINLGWGGEVTLAGKRIGITHGHIPREYRRLRASNPDYLFTGHTHIPSDRIEGATRDINPGALHRASQYTVMIGNLADDQFRLLRVPE
ncbi:metallophosphoesterase family protein [Schlesneria sp.]|uniref:metallophosphoesterase family protein n=1 Tax=Schlesneria sp. TaxID=2762018 RepID=UPI002EFFF8AD